MAKVFLYSKDMLEAQEIRQFLEQYYHDIVFSMTSKNLLTNLYHSKSDILIYSSTTINQNTLNYINDLCTKGFDKPVILLVDNKGYSSRDKLNSKRVHIMEKADMENQLNRLCHQIVNHPDLSPQAFKRFLTFQPMTLLSIINKTSIISHMTNLSLGGACCEFNYDPHFILGDIVQLQIPLDKVNKQYNVHAKVMWQKVNEIKGNIELGLKFISEKDMNKYII